MKRKCYNCETECLRLLKESYATQDILKNRIRELESQLLETSPNASILKKPNPCPFCKEVPNVINGVVIHTCVWGTTLSIPLYVWDRT